MPYINACIQMAAGTNDDGDHACTLLLCSLTRPPTGLLVLGPSSLHNELIPLSAHAPTLWRTIFYVPEDHDQKLINMT